MERLIEIPNGATIRGARFLGRSVDWNIDPGDTTIVRFHPRWSHVQPWLLCAIAAWADHARAAGMEIHVENQHTARYAWRFGLHRFLGHAPIPPVVEHEEAGRFIPLKRIRTREDLSALIAEIPPMLHLHTDPDAAHAIQYIVSETVRNVLEHASSPLGAVVCAQLYSETRDPYISIGVADGGVGVRTSLQRNFPELTSDRDAVLTAIRPGTSGAHRGIYGSSENAGAGLFYTRSFSHATRRYFAICSGGAMFRSSIASDRRPDDEELVFPVADYGGTIVCAELGMWAMFEFSEIFANIGRAFTVTTRDIADTAIERIRFT